MDTSRAAERSLPSARLGSTSRTRAGAPSRITPRCTVLDLNGPFGLEALADEPQIGFVDHATPDIAVHLQRVEGGIALHLIRYDYDEVADRVPVLPELRIDVRLPEAYPSATAVSPDGSLVAVLSVDGTTHRIELRDVPLYGIVLLR